MAHATRRNRLNRDCFLRHAMLDSTGRPFSQADRAAIVDQTDNGFSPATHILPLGNELLYSGEELVDACARREIAKAFENRNDEAVRLFCPMRQNQNGCYSVALSNSPQLLRRWLSLHIPDDERRLVIFVGYFRRREIGHVSLHAIAMIIKQTMETEIEDALAAYDCNLIFLF